MQKFETDQRLVQFRLSNEATLKLIASGLLPEDFSKQDLTDLVKGLVSKASDIEPIEIPVTHTKPILATLQEMDQKLGMLVGKFLPQAI